MIRISPLTDSHAPAYDAFIAAHPDAVLYHTRVWMAVLQQTYGYHPATLIAEQDGAIVGVLPLMRVHGRVKGRRLVGLPFSHCLPLLTHEPAAASALLDAAIDLTRREQYRYLELRPRHPLPHEAFQPVALNVISELDITPDPDTIYKNFTKTNRNSIAAAGRSELRFREGVSRADFALFNQMETDTRHRQGAPMYPPGFFTRLYDQMRAHVKLYFVTLHGEAVAGMLMLNFGQRAIYGYGSSTRDPEIRRLNPNNLLLWEAIQRLKAEGGYTLFDFGTTPAHHKGLLDFKERFNPVTSELPSYFYLHTKKDLPIIQRDSAGVRRVEAVLQRLPREVFRQLSPFLLREVG